MGDYSRDPISRFSEAVEKRYVGVRMQQGVPVLDTDWNELEDLRKYEGQSFAKNFIGDGVPANNDGFRVGAYAGNGVNTIVLRSTLVSEVISTIAVDFSASTAASVLGFGSHNLYAENYQGGFAQITGNASEPFLLVHGATLSVSVNGGAIETVTFNAADFASINAATALEVSNVINAVLANAVAAVGNGNDFKISGGEGSLDSAGRILVSGHEVWNKFDLAYSSQALYMNNDLALLWDVPVLNALQEPPATDRTDLVYLDVWEREVTSEEDEAIVVAAIGVESTIRLKREWVVRVATDTDDIDDITQLPGHVYSALALIERTVANQEQIPEVNITDLRQRQLTLADLVISPIMVKGELGVDKVNSGLFSTLLHATDLVYQELLSSDYFLSDNFSDITAVESVLVLSAFQDVRNYAQSGALEASLKRLDNKAALDFLNQLYDLQKAFVETLQPLAALTVQRAGTVLLLDELTEWLDGNGSDIPGLRDSVLSSASPNLGNAYDAQVFINDRLGRRTGVLPQGGLDIQFVSAPMAAITAGGSHQFVYSIQSLLSVDENIELSLSDTQGLFDFEFVGLDEDPNHPGDAAHALLPLTKDATENVAFNLIVPGGTPAGAQSRIVLSARSQLNPGDIDFANMEIVVEVNSTVTLPASDLELLLQFPEINIATDTVSIGKSSLGGHMTFQINATFDAQSTTSEEFVISVDFIGNGTAFEVLGAATLTPFMMSGSTQPDTSIVPTSLNVPIGAVNAATDGLSSLMILRLSKTGDGTYREIPIQIVTDV